jgi:hypothetical protein
VGVGMGREEEQRKMKYQQLGQLLLIKIHIQKGTQSLGTLLDLATIESVFIKVAPFKSTHT